MFSNIDVAFRGVYADDDVVIVMSRAIRAKASSPRASPAAAWVEAVGGLT